MNSNSRGSGGKRGTGGYRGLSVRVKSARGRKISSTKWLQRHLNDPYVQRSKIDGLRSRAAYKILEIDEKYNLLRKGHRIVDLGAAPGGWSQVAAERVGSHIDDIRVVGIDYLSMEPLPGVTLLEKDFLDDDAPDQLREALGGHMADLVLSDMAAPTTGHKQTDHMRIIQLCEVAVEFAREVLKPGGAFVAKVFQGGTEHTLLNELKRDFKKVGHYKPPASRKDSAETYLIARDYRGRDSKVDTEAE
ncbi:RlmE family RNA methyltransferase [Pararhizobium sp. IMCC21322]|uniref:RlmE family RNA methyltransferase n=1 Tax=Pararhizobium sp. IMCC21322 TaxID=3067903 RepID=UPI0027424A09|nr:RlmE family RNA methyltransferase [Pararhizobium sp. IMCC21322]